MQRRTERRYAAPIPRYWEDVKVGDELTPVVRGPLNEAELTAWHAAGHAHFISERVDPHHVGEDAAVPPAGKGSINGNSAKAF